MLQWRNWHTRQIQTLFSPGSTPGWSTIFEINSGGDFVNNISAVAIGMLIAAHTNRFTSSNPRVFGADKPKKSQP